MCLLIPGKIVKIKKDKATIDYGAEKREVNIVPGLKIKKGDYGIVQAKYIIQKVSKKEALESLKMYSKI